MLDIAYDFIKDISKQGGNVLFVGTKKQAKDAIQFEAERCGSCYVSSRWLGGTLTNLHTIRKRIARLDQIEEMEKAGTLNYMTKKEASMLLLEKAKLLTKFGGIRNMKTYPDAMFVIDPKNEYIAVREARTLHIPVVAACDTNCDPNVVDYLIPANDDAVRAVKLLCSTVASAVIEGHEGNVPIEESSIELGDVESHFMESDNSSDNNSSNNDNEGQE